MRNRSTSHPPYRVVVAAAADVDAPGTRVLAAVQGPHLRLGLRRVRSVITRARRRARRRTRRVTRRRAKSRARRRVMRTRDRGGGQRKEDGRRMTEDGGFRQRMDASEDRGRRAKDRGRRAEDLGRRKDSHPFHPSQGPQFLIIQG